MKTLSIIIPVFNEKATIENVIQAVRDADVFDLNKEIILVDDFSTDGTRNILENLKIENLRILFNEKNMGKGFSLRRGFESATGDFLIIQDADLEYDPKEYKQLLEPMMFGQFDVVYGSRFKELKDPKIYFKIYFLANRFLTCLSNIFTGLSLTDMETCYKCFTREAILKIGSKLRSNRFEIEPEITAQVAKLNLKIKEVPISYFRRSYVEGKKIVFKDGLSAIWTIVNNPKF